MKIVKPQALRKGDVIGIAAPASPPESEERLEKGIRYLERLGYRIVLGSHLHRRRGYLAGTDRERVSDLFELFSRPDVKAVFTARGGYGCMRILPYLDYSFIRKHPKILVGYSDITALQIALFARAGLVTFSGPMVAVEMAEGLDGKREEQFWRTLTSTKPLGNVHVRKLINPTKRNPAGRIIGGNLSLVAALATSSFFPKANNHIFLLEEIGERPYRIDRMLQQISLAGIFKKTNGIVLGSFKDCGPEAGKPSLTLSEVIEQIFRPFRFPVVGRLPYGHTKKSLTIPVGIRVRLNVSDGNLEFLESGVV